MRPPAIQSCGRSPRWPTTAGVPSSLTASYSTPCGSSIGATCRLSQLRGGWAGEIGQTQFLPTPYVRYAVDFDGNGHRDLVHSVPDILASTANFLVKATAGSADSPGNRDPRTTALSPHGTKRPSTSAPSQPWPANWPATDRVADQTPVHSAMRRARSSAPGRAAAYGRGRTPRRTSRSSRGAAVARAEASDTSRSSVPGYAHHRALYRFDVDGCRRRSVKHPEKQLEQGAAGFGDEFIENDGLRPAPHPVERVDDRELEVRRKAASRMARATSDLAPAASRRRSRAGCRREAPGRPGSGPAPILGGELLCLALLP